MTDEDPKAYSLAMYIRIACGERSERARQAVEAFCLWYHGFVEEDNCMRNG